MDPITGAAAITAGASLLGGLFGSHSSKKTAEKDRAESARQFDAQMDYAKNQTQIRVKDALKAGINPLAALGVSANVSPTFHAGGGDNSGEIMSNAISGAGSAIGKALEAKARDDMSYDSQAKELDLEGKRLENRILQQRIDAATNKAGEGVEQPRMMGQKTLFTPVYDLQGRPRLVLDQNVMETDADNPGYTSSMIATLADAAKRGDIDLVSGSIKNPQLRMLIDDFYYNTTGHRITNLEDLYISPAEAAAITAYMARGMS